MKILILNVAERSGKVMTDFVNNALRNHSFDRLSRGQKQSE